MTGSTDKAIPIGDWSEMVPRNEDRTIDVQTM
jgi:hypothetical protein